MASVVARMKREATTAVVICAIQLRTFIRAVRRRVSRGSDMKATVSCCKFLYEKQSQANGFHSRRACPAILLRREVRKTQTLGFAVNDTRPDVWMWIFLSMLFVSMSLVITSICYKKFCPGTKLTSTELVLFPFRLKICFHYN